MMSSIIPELGDNLSEYRQQSQEITNHRTLLPEPATNMGVSGCGVMERKRTYVCHGPTKEERTSTV